MGKMNSILPVLNHNGAGYVLMIDMMLVELKEKKHEKK